jgi:1,4-dihydroxy-2-naphthoate polyprenyltransferase
MQMKNTAIKKPGLGEFSAILRLPFISVSILAFVFGSLIERRHFNVPAFLLGLACVIATHLAANLLNDYADSRSGVDWHDLRPYKFFGGSKFIQLGLLEEKFYLRLAIFCSILALACLLLLAAAIRTASTAVLFYLLIMFLSWSYSCPPLQLSYRRMGEPVIFLLFGPALVMGGYFIQTRVFPDFKSFILSLPFGILTAAILFANEIPDFPVDEKSNKATGVAFLGARKSYLVYFALIVCAFASVAAGLALGFLGKITYVSFIFLLPAVKATGILKKYYAQKEKLVVSSRLTIAVHNFVSLALIAGIIFSPKC